MNKELVQFLSSRSLVSSKVNLKIKCQTVDPYWRRAVLCACSCVLPRTTILNTTAAAMPHIHTKTRMSRDGMSPVKSTAEQIINGSANQ